MTPITTPIIRVALSGKMRSGKDTVANWLIGSHGFTRYAFADKLKDVAEDLFGMVKGEKKGDRNRALLQALGWRMCQIDQEVWVRHVLGKIPQDRSVVITDLRFPVEYQMLMGRGFYAVRIDIDPGEQWRRIMLSTPDMSRELLDDMSETALDDCTDWDYRLDGGRGFDDLYRQVELMMDRFRNKSCMDRFRGMGHQEACHEE